MNSESCRFQRRFLIWMVVYGVVIVVDAWLLPHPRRTDLVHVVGALVPLIPLLFAGVAIVRSVRAMDELYRRIHAEGLLFGVLGTIGITMTVGFLQWLAAVPTFSLGWVFPMIGFLYGIGVQVGQRRYA